MTFSIEMTHERGLDTMLIVYSLLEGHPASAACEAFLRARTGWFTTTFALFEAKAILTKVYSVETTRVTEKLVQFTSGPVHILPFDAAATLAALHLADTFRLDMTDAALLYATQACGATHLATDDGKLSQICKQQGLTVENAIDFPLRQHITNWEESHLTAKGLPRVLREIHYWLQQADASVAANFWSETGAGSHLP